MVRKPILVTMSEDKIMPEEFSEEKKETESIASLTEPEDTEEIKKEISDAIDTVVNDDFDDVFSEPEFESFYHANPEEFQASYSNVLKYWHRDDSPVELSTHYDKGYTSSDGSDQKSVIIAQETKEYNTAIKTNFNARVRNEFGLSIPGTEETFAEKESNFMFKVLNPGLWKFMYDASAYMVFSSK